PIWAMLYYCTAPRLGVGCGATRRASIFHTPHGILLITGGGVGDPRGDLRDEDTEIPNALQVNRGPVIAGRGGRPAVAIAGARFIDGFGGRARADPGERAERAACHGPGARIPHDLASCRVVLQGCRVDNLPERRHVKAGVAGRAWAIPGHGAFREVVL